MRLSGWPSSAAIRLTDQDGFSAFSRRVSSATDNRCVMGGALPASSAPFGATASTPLDDFLCSPLGFSDLQPSLLAVLLGFSGFFKPSPDASGDGCESS